MENSMSTNNKGFNALTTSTLKPRIVFLKNEKYECQGSVVVCIETTCSYTSPTFKAIYIGQTGQWSKGDGTSKFEGFFGESRNCLCSNYKPYNKEITL